MQFEGFTHTAFALPLVALAFLGAPIAPADANETLTLEQHVLPILTKNCMGCHGGLRQKGGLDLRTPDSILAGGESGAALVPGKPDQSELWLQIASGEMPKGHDKLSDADKDTLHAWIAAGSPTFSGRGTALDEPHLPQGQKHAPQQVADAIDGHIGRGLDALRLHPSPISDDAEFLRRIYLDLTGRIPTPDQAAEFLDSTAPQKRPELVDALLESPAFGEHFGRTWRDWICPPELPSDMNSGKQPVQEAQNLGTWFAKRFNAGQPWDKTVQDLLGAEGDIKDHPQIIFFGLAGQNAKATPDGTTRSVASLFMGVQIGCAQCHDDPYRDWAQRDFWAMAAFFGNVEGDFKKIAEKPAQGRITIPDSAFENAGTHVPAAFLGARQPELDPEKKIAWRPEFTTWLTSADNPFFARAFANRLWFHFLARGIVNPIDDLRALNPPSHPGLLSLLANEFAASEFDVKHLVRCICLSQTYQRSSLPNSGTAASDPLRIAENFGRMPLRVMTADMLYSSLQLAFDDPKLDLRSIVPEDGNQNGESAAVADAYHQFQRDFCTDEEYPSLYTHGIPQMLTLINHPRLLTGSKALDAYLNRDPKPSPEQAVERLYLSTLSRRPSADESAEALAYLSGSNGDGASHSDILWMLVNRSEFSLIR